VLVPRVGDAPRRERVGSLEIRRFRYFPRRWEDLADGAILENLRTRLLRWLQVPPFLVGEAIALRRLIAEFDPDVLHVHWVLPQGLVAAIAAPGRRWVLTAHGGMCTPWRAGSPPASNGSPSAARPPSRCRTRRCASPPAARRQS
jgi:colanic acid/amylovoran biosynthesis glycosyltransferase